MEVQKYCHQNLLQEFKTATDHHLILVLINDLKNE